MRNLKEYPITLDEVIECLEQFYKEVDPEKTRACGDMRPLLLRKAIEILSFING